MQPRPQADGIASAHASVVQHHSLGSPCPIRLQLCRIRFKFGSKFDVGGTETEAPEQARSALFTHAQSDDPPTAATGFRGLGITKTLYTHCTLFFFLFSCKNGSVSRALGSPQLHSTQPDSALVVTRFALDMRFSSIMVFASRSYWHA